MPQYKLEKGDLLEMEKKLNALSQQGWKPILMSNVQPHAFSLEPPNAGIAVKVLSGRVADVFSLGIYFS